MKHCLKYPPTFDKMCLRITDFVRHSSLRQGAFSILGDKWPSNHKRNFLYGPITMSRNLVLPFKVISDEKRNNGFSSLRTFAAKSCTFVDCTAISFLRLVARCTRCGRYWFAAWLTSNWTLRRLYFTLLGTAVFVWIIVVSNHCHESYPWRCYLHLPLQLCRRVRPVESGSTFRVCEEVWNSSMVIGPFW